MKKACLILALLFLFTPVFGETPTKYVNCTIEVRLQEKGVINENISLIFPKYVNEFNYYITHPATNLKVFTDREIKCKIQYGPMGTLISCKNFNSSKIHMYFEYFGTISQNKEFYVFSDRYIISTPTENFKLRIYLPKGYILSDQKENRLPYFPVDGVQKTDGRTIYVEWNRNPKLGEIYDVSLVYEKAIKSDQFIVFVSTFLIILVMLLMFFFFRRKPKISELGLKEYERKFLEVLSEENKISQRRIALKLNLSKAQVSRIAKSLEERGLIERKKKGRSYEVILKNK